jgi:hypothetical protein
MGTVTDSAGVMVVRNPAEGIWRRGEEPRVKEVLRIGQAEGAPEYQFGAITGVNVDAEGQIYVGDSQAQEIRVFDQDGVYLRTIGRPGSGPGELGPGGTGVFFGQGDTLFVPDPAQQRVNLFLRAGSFVRSFPVPMSQGISVKWAITPERELLQQVRRLALPGAEQESGPDLVLRRGSDGAIRDTALSFPAGMSVRFSGGAPAIKLFEPEPIWELAEDGGLYFAINSDFRVEVRSAAGELERVLQKPFERQPVTEADREVFREYIQKAFERQGVPPAAMQMVMQGISFADHYPAFATILAGPEGSLWVQQIQTAKRAAAAGGTFSAEEVGAPEWDVFDREGRFLGVVTLPARFQPRRFHAKRLYGVLQDELDVPYAVALELSGGFGGE